MSEKDYKPVKTSKVGGSPFTGVLGGLIIAYLFQEFC